MKLSSQFTVPAEPERVFAHFLDPDVMRTSIPGCTELAREDDATYSGRLENVVAHVRFNARFSATIVSMDAPRQVEALLKGDDRKLGSSIKVTAKLTVAPDPAGSLVGYALEMALWGKVGRLGEAIVRRRSVEMEQEFVKRFAAACTAGETTTATEDDAPVPVPHGDTRTTSLDESAAPAAEATVVATAGSAAPEAAQPAQPARAAGEPRRLPTEPDRGERPRQDVRAPWWRRLIDRIRRRWKGGADQRRTR
ncbi:SRPBCC domain-containing protein [Streptomyces sp. NPDC005438]|uniref:CoxG family protein n=1 Tax=Streptomyces sp. NPDC005438 TaxID=3156880 RepID=UPI0033B069B9